MEYRKKINRITVIAFCFFFIGSFAFLLCKPSKEFSENENRELAQIPDITLSSILTGDFMNDFESYVSDQFYARSFFVSMKAEAERVSGKTENNEVFFGKDNYLIGKLTDSLKKANANLIAMKSFADYLDKDYHVEFVLCPTAAEIMKDKLPSFGYNDCQNELFEYSAQLLKDSNIQFIDTRNSFYDAKKTGRQLYYKTDHHYTSFGAYTAYVSFCKANNMQPLPEDDFHIATVTDSFYGSQWTKASLFGAQADTIERYDIDGLSCQITIKDGEKSIANDSLYFDKYLTTKDKYSYFVDGVHPLYEIHTNVKNGKSILLFKDSYAHSVVPFLANHYENIYMIDLRYYNGNVMNYIKSIGVKDIVFYYNANTFATDNTIKKIAYTALAK